jgi:hypothetical protein
VSQGSPRVAISNCYSRFVTSEAFDRGTRAQQERFLYEFTDACLRAARKPNLPPEETLEFLEQGIEVAKRYVSWYKGLDNESQRNLQRTSQDRIGIIVFLLGDLHDRADKRAEMLEDFEEIADSNVAFFIPDSAKLWEKVLRSYPDFKRERSVAEIQELLKTDDVYVVHWENFRSFVDKLAIVPGKKAQATLIKARIKKIFG